MISTVLAPGHTPVSITATAGGLAAIATAGIDLAIWCRELPGDIAKVLADESREAWPSGTWHGCVEALSAAGALIDDPRWRGLDADLRCLAKVFAHHSGCRSLSINLDIVTDDACKRFHADFKRLRLITTYAGPGTEWRLGDPDDPINRRRAGTPAARRRYGIARFAPGAVGLFKGRLWPDHAVRVVHRSPPIAGTGQRRLVLVIDQHDNAGSDPVSFARH